MDDINENLKRHYKILIGYLNENTVYAALCEWKRNGGGPLPKIICDFLKTRKGFKAGLSKSGENPGDVIFMLDDPPLDQVLIENDYIVTDDTDVLTILNAFNQIGDCSHSGFDFDASWPEIKNRIVDPALRDDADSIVGALDAVLSGIRLTKKLKDNDPLSPLRDSPETIENIRGLLLDFSKNRKVIEFPNAASYLDELERYLKVGQLRKTGMSLSKIALEVGHKVAGKNKQGDGRDKGEITRALAKLADNDLMRFENIQDNITSGLGFPGPNYARKRKRKQPAK